MLDYQVDNGKIIAVKPYKEDLCSRGRPCIKGLTSHEPVTVERITEPMIRKEGKLVKASWQEAYEFIKKNTHKLKPDQVFFLGSGGHTNEDNYILQKFARTVFRTNNVDTCARLCHAATAVAFLKTINLPCVPNKMDDVLDCDVILAVGTNPVTNYPVFFNRILEAKNKGAKLIVVNFERILTSKFADINVIINHDGTIAFLGGIINYLIKKSKTDEEMHLKESVKKFTPEFVAEACSIDKEDFVRVAETVAAAKKLATCHGMGITQHINGTQNVIALTDIALLKNAVIMPMRGKVNVQGAGDVGCSPTFKFSKIRTKGRMYTEAFYHTKPKFMYVMGTNPAKSLPDINFVEKKLKKMFIVYQHHHPGPTMDFASVVLPSPMLMESDGTITNGESRVRRTREVVAPPGGKGDWQILCELAKVFGFEKEFAYKNAEEIFAEITKTIPSYSSLSWENVTEGQSQFVDKSARKDTLALFNTNLPCEAITSPDYPFVLTTARSQHHFCTAEDTQRSTTLRKLTPEPYCYMSLEDAQTLGIRDMQLVEVESKVGKIMLKAKLNPDVRIGTVIIPFHFDSVLVNRLFPHAGIDKISGTPNYKTVGVRVTRV